MKQSSIGSFVILLVIAGCTTEFKSPDEDTSVDTGTHPDTTIDTGVADTPVDVGPDALPDTGSDPEPDVTECIPVTAEQGGMCNALVQCGCPGDQWCMFGMGYPGCLAVEQCTATAVGTQPVGEYCNPLTGINCHPGLECLSTPEGSRCFKYCLDDSDCTIADQSCWRPVDIVGVGLCDGAIVTLPVNVCDYGSPTCVQECTGPFDFESCPAELSCTYDGGCDTLVCAETGTTAVGDACAGVGECVAGSECFGIDTDFVCMAWCNDDYPCDTAESCMEVGLESWPDLAVCYIAP